MEDSDIPNKRTIEETILSDVMRDDMTLTKSEEEFFAESVQSTSSRRRSSFPFVAGETEDAKEETQSLCNETLLSVNGGSKYLDSSGTGYRAKSCSGLLLAASSRVPAGSTRSIHTANQKILNSSPHDFASSTQPRRKFIQLLRQASVQIGLDFCFATEGALVTPILLQLGLPGHLYGLAWFLAPILGFIMAPLIGSASDRCYSSWGQRRPFILLLGIGVIIGTGLYLNSADIGALVSGNDSATWGIAITVLGVVLTDFSADSCTAPFAAYLLDICNLEDLIRVLSIKSTLGGIAGGLGYICIGIDWERTFVGRALGSQLRVIFLLNIIIFVISLIITLTSIAEIPLKHTQSFSKSIKNDAADGNAKATDADRTRRKPWRLCQLFKRNKRRDRVPSCNELAAGRGDSGECKQRETSNKRRLTNEHGDEETHNFVHDEKIAKEANRNQINDTIGISVKYKQCSGDGQCNSNARRHFRSNKELKHTNKKTSAKSSEGKRMLNDTGNALCLVKISINNEPTDSHGKAQNMKEGFMNGCPHEYAPTHGGNISITCIVNPTAEIMCHDDDEGGESDDDDDKNSESQSLLQLLQSVIHMPKELRYLCMTNFFSWASIGIALCFYTDFVAQAVYHGDPSAPEDSEEYRLYEEGVKMGSWGLCIYAFFSSAVALSMTVLQRHFSQRILYASCQLIFALGCSAMALLTNYVYVILFLCVGLGLNSVIINTIPHNILANYHKNEQYKNPEKGLPRGLGTDMACIDCQVFLSQITISAAMGPLIQLTGSHIAIVVSAALMSFIASLLAAFLVTYEIKQT